MTTDVEYEYKLEYFANYDPDYGWNPLTYEWVSLEAIEKEVRENLQDDKEYGEEDTYEYRYLRRPVNQVEVVPVDKKVFA